MAGKTAALRRLLAEETFIHPFAVAEVQDPYEALREGGRRYRALALEHPMVYQLMFLRTVPGFEPSDHALEVAGAAFAYALAVRCARAWGIWTLACC